MDRGRKRDRSPETVLDRALTVDGKALEAFESRDYDAVKTFLSDVKVLLGQFGDLPKGQIVTGRILAREVYQRAVIVSVITKDYSAYERVFSLLEPYYTDANRLYLRAQTTQEYAILRFNLLRLLLQDKVEEFHDELNHLSTRAKKSPLMMKPIEWGPGNYNYVYTASEVVNFLLSGTDWDEIYTRTTELEACMEVYKSPAITDEQKLLLLVCHQKIVKFLENRPEWEMRDGYVFMKRVEEEPCEEVRLINQIKVRLINQMIQYVLDMKEENDDVAADPEPVNPPE